MGRVRNTVTRWLLAMTILGVAVPAVAQTLTTTSVSTAQTATSTTLTVASGTGFGGTYLAVVDREAELVTDIVGTTATVQRGYAGLTQAHSVGATVYVGPVTVFHTAEPSSQSCNPSQSSVPWINIQLGTIYTCGPVGLWTSLNLLPATGSAGSVLVSNGPTVAASFSTTFSGSGNPCPGDGTTVIEQVATNDLGVFTGAANCLGGTQRFDVSATAVTFGVKALFPDGTAAAPSLAFASTPLAGIANNGVGVFGFTNGSGSITANIDGLSGDINASNSIRAKSNTAFFSLGGSSDTKIKWVSAGNLSVGDSSTAAWNIGTAGIVDQGLHTITAGSRISAGALTVDAAGLVGTPVVVGGPTQRKVGATSAQTIGSYTVGASDGSFDVSANINVTTATAHSFTVTCAYTNENNVAQTYTFGFNQLSGAVFITAITNVTGVNSYESGVVHLRAKAGTTITIATTGTFTTVTYNGEGLIRQTS